MFSSNSHLFRPQGSERAEYKGLVLVATICLVLFQFTCILFFISSVVFPLKLILLHASLRCRNTKSKVIAHFGPQFSYGSYIFQVSNVAETFGLKKRTPMGFLLNELGIEPDMYMNKKKTMWISWKFQIWSKCSIIQAWWDIILVGLNKSSMSGKKSRYLTKLIKVSLWYPCGAENHSGAYLVKSITFRLWETEKNLYSYNFPINQRRSKLAELAKKTEGERWKLLRMPLKDLEMAPLRNLEEFILGESRWSVSI